MDGFSTIAGDGGGCDTTGLGCGVNALVPDLGGKLRVGGHTPSNVDFLGGGLVGTLLISCRVSVMRLELCSAG
jgi:hypothetical protein